MVHRESTDDSAARIREGDDAAYEALFRAEYASLVRFALRYLHDTASAEDTVQDVFLGLWQNRDRIDPGTPLRGYLFRAVRNRSLNRLRDLKTRRRAAERVRLTSDVAIAPDTGEADVARLRAALAAAVETLPARCRLIFGMSRDHGLSYSEIASALGLSIKTVETQMGRALRTLRQRLEQYRPEPPAASD